MVASSGNTQCGICGGEGANPWGRDVTCVCPGANLDAVVDVENRLRAAAAESAELRRRLDRCVADHNREASEWLAEVDSLRTEVERLRAGLEQACAMLNADADGEPWTPEILLTDAGVMRQWRDRAHKVLASLPPGDGGGQ